MEEEKAKSRKSAAEPRAMEIVGQQTPRAGSCTEAGDAFPYRYLLLFPVPCALLPAAAQHLNSASYQTAAARFRYLLLLCSSLQLLLYLAATLLLRQKKAAFASASLWIG